MDKETPSIAVLPFVNMSKDEDNEYFADGLAEELLTVLTKIRGLRVASRTSAFSFKGKDVDIPTVAQKLNVANILEGSVRKSGKRVRITAQLIQVATDSHLWSESYDRELDDIFAVQDDIAQSVVKELRSALLGEHLGPQANAEAKAEAKAEVQAATTGRADNPEAHRLYLQGRFFLERMTQADVARSVELFEQAIALDPEFALAMDGPVASRSTRKPGTAGRRSPPGSNERAKPRNVPSRSPRISPKVMCAWAWSSKTTTGTGRLPTSNSGVRSSSLPATGTSSARCRAWPESSAVSTRRSSSCRRRWRSTR